jgi:hypothetical protein
LNNGFRGIQKKIALYGEFGAVVERILREAINESDTPLQLWQIQHRAKSPSSLEKKTGSC